jgi:MFS family permease
MSTTEQIQTPPAPTVAADAPAPVSRRRLRPMAAFVGAIVAFIGVPFAAGAPSPLFVLYQREWHFPDWTLTVAFAIYAVTLLVALVVAGSLSDHIGRRPVLIGALALQAIAMAMFVVAPDIGWIIVARAIQGVATGAATSTFTATIVELAPARHRRLGALIGSTAPLGGLALGALLSGLAVQFTAEPGVILFSFLALFFLGGIVVIAAAPETVTRRAGAVRSLIPRLSVAAGARKAFAAGVPVLVATWMLSGLFLGLAPSIDHDVFGISSGVVNGLIVAMPPAAAAIVGLVFGRFSADSSVRVGLVLVLAGTLMTVLGIEWGPFWLFALGGIVGGAGVGAAFSGTLRGIAPLAASHQRAELFAAIYLVSYLSYGAPVIVAGELVGVIGLQTTAAGYGAVVALVTLAAIIALAARAVALRRAPRPTREASGAETIAAMAPRECAG